MDNDIILVDKPSGISSFGVVAKVRGFLKAKYGRKVKLGHTGTLDPFATGLLILLSGKMTKRSNDFLRHNKTYEATIHLGATSTTGDPEGEITPVSDLEPSLEDIKSVLTKFTGTITQTPPKYSAIKINGERAYKLARAGQDFEVPSREVTIYNTDIIKYTYPELIIKTDVSSGTYIRTLAEDIGNALHTGAYLTALRRTRIGDYSVADAHSLTEFTDGAL